MLTHTANINSNYKAIQFKRSINNFAIFTAKLTTKSWLAHHHYSIYKRTLSHSQQKFDLLFILYKDPPNKTDPIIQISKTNLLARERNTHLLFHSQLIQWWLLPRRTRIKLEEFLPTFSLLSTSNPTQISKTPSCRVTKSISLLYKHNEVSANSEY